jgi:hypothetical protein
MSEIAGRSMLRRSNADTNWTHQDADLQRRFDSRGRQNSELLSCGELTGRAHPYANGLELNGNRIRATKTVCLHVSGRTVRHEDYPDPLLVKV